MKAKMIKDKVRDMIHEAWCDGDLDIEGMEGVLLILNELNQEVMYDYNNIYDNLDWGEVPSEYEEEEALDA